MLGRRPSLIAVAALRSRPSGSLYHVKAVSATRSCSAASEEVLGGRHGV